MKLNFIASALAAGVMVAGSAYAAPATPTVVDGGKVHFTGSLVDAACAVSSASDDQTVDLKQIRTANLAKSGDTAGDREFTIELVDCNTDMAKTASIAFSGTTDGKNPNALITTAGGNSQGAKNVGVQILDSTSQPVGLDGASFSSPTTLADGNGNQLRFRARYIALNDGATAGQANAEATFKIQYN